MRAEGTVRRQQRKIARSPRKEATVPRDGRLALETLFATNAGRTSRLVQPVSTRRARRVVKLASIVGLGAYRPRFTIPHCMTTSRADQLDPAVLAALGHLELVARWVVDGFITGLHRSPRKGFSVEFAEHRPYMPGDDLRYLDWRIAARADRWVVKQFEEETNARAMIVLDVSRSMQWTGDPGRLTKLAYAERLAAAVALLLIRQRDAVGLLRFDAGTRSVVTPRAQRAQWRRLVAAFSEPGGGEASDVASALLQAGRLVRRPGFVVLLSDLLVDPIPVADAARTLRARGHEVLVLHVMDPAERDFPEAGEALYRDLETRVEVPAAPADVRNSYQATVREALAEWRAVLGRAGARYALSVTDEPYGRALRHLVGVNGRGAMV